MTSPSPSEPTGLAALQIELGKKPIELAVFVAAAATTVTLAGMNLAISRYLTVFGHSGLIAAADGFSPALIRSLGFLFVAILVLTTMMIAAPVFSRHLVGNVDDHPLAAGFDWPNKVEGHRLSNLQAYLVAHGPLVTLLIYYGLASLFPKPFNHQTGMTIAYVVGLVPAGLFVWMGEVRHRTWKDFVVTVLTAGQLGLLALSWFVAVLVLFGAPSASATSLSWTNAFGMIGLILAVLGAHWFLTVISAHAWASVTFGLAILVGVVVVAPGDLTITHNALRLAGVGGGVLKTYRDPRAKPDAPPKAACLILATGDMRVIKLAPTPADCDAAAMRDLFFKLRRDTAQERLRDLALVRVVKSQIFIDTLTPADMALEPATIVDTSRRPQPHGAPNKSPGLEAATTHP